MITVEIGEAGGPGVLGGTVPSRVQTITVSGTRTVTVEHPLRGSDGEGNRECGIPKSHGCSAGNPVRYDRL